ncbi:MAG: HAMP domain-containing histidine kinase [Oscillospiraceae bacterium]|nr:HAMP domain-containing histidine kinase [Oscillospiraceae bacterium]MBQ9938747.1 HAMP domain-containing histidine kinase [Oscillospiraceae bacterium]
MKNKRSKRSYSLIPLLTLIIFCSIAFFMVLVNAANFFLMKAGVIDSASFSQLTPPQLVILMLLFSFLLGIVVSAIANRYPLKPIATLIDHMNRLASGDFKTRLKFKKAYLLHPDFNELTNSFNQMAQELENTEILRSDFINNFSHEFKTPIVSISGFAKLLKRDNLTEAQRLEYATIIEEESLRLASMATNVLNLSKCENQTILTDVSEFNLSEQIRSCILSLESKWAKKNLEFDLDFDEVTVSANKDMLKQVWLNLIDNAIKFSANEGTIEIHISENGSFYDISVLNYGSEIPPEKQPYIFDKFYQADESHSTDGNGIGLAVVKHITLLHKGSISVRSENNTTAFTVSLPKS